jgi:hypothetical protein
LRLARRRAAELAADTWQEPAELPEDHLARIAFWQEWERLANVEVVAAIDAARGAGAKWWEIGAAMGRTAEAARGFRHYQRKTDVRDDTE